MRHSLLAVLGCLAFSITAHASDISFNLTNGALTPSGSFSGSFLINSATEMLDGGSVTATLPAGGPTYNFSAATGDSTIPGLEIFTDANGDTFVLALNGAISALAINTTPIWGTSDTNFTLASGARFDALSGVVTETSPAVTPEPSSLLMLGTGALGLAGSFRRRFLHT